MSQDVSQNGTRGYDAHAHEQATHTQSRPQDHPRTPNASLVRRFLVFVTRELAVEIAKIGKMRMLITAEEFSNENDREC